MLKLTASLPLLLCAVTPQVATAAGPAATPTAQPPAAAASPQHPTTATATATATPPAGHSGAGAPPAAAAQHPAAADAGGAGHGHGGPPPPPAILHPSERNLRNLRQLTFGGENAEAYWSFDGGRLSMQSTTAADRCDQIYTLDVPSGPAVSGAPARPLVPLSAGHGRNTCSFFFPDGGRVLFSATRHVGDACPPVPDRSKGYVWPLYNYQIYSSRPDGSDVRRLTETQSYDAEATICRDGSVVFTSDRDGDLELYRMNLDGSGVKRLTFAPGYDGGAFFSEDCKRLVWRAARPRSAEELAEMKGLLKQHLVRPTRMELWTGNADGSDAHAVTELGAASFAPFFIPTSAYGPKDPVAAPDRRIIFSSNYGDPRGREFDLWAINSDGSRLERVTHSPDFDGFPMFSPDGKRLVFASNRGGKQRGETNVFLVDWVPLADPVYTPTPADTAAQRVAWLAAPAREGRGVGTKGLGAAADELAKWMKESGLTPAGEPLGKAPSAGRGYFHSVEVFVGVRDQGSRFRIVSSAAEPAGRPLAATEAVPSPMSASGKFEGALRFAGFGITAPESGWDDLAGLDVKGQVVVVLRGVPTDKLSAKSQRSYSDLRYKAWNLREHGAQAVIFVDPRTDGVPKLTLDGPEGGAGLPVAVVPRALLAKLLPAAADGKAGPQGPIDDPLQPLVRAAEEAKSAAVPVGAKLAGEVKLARESRRERNVVGLLPATGAPSAQTPAVVIGAHYDHLGLGGRSSLAPGTPAVHPGADDNASGTAAMLALAQSLAADKERPYDVYFVAFTAEESGLVGSSRFVQTLVPGLAKERMRAMLNFDMVGRLGGLAGTTTPSVSVQGSDSAEEWAQLVAPSCTKSALKCTLGGDGYGPSDMTPFYAAGVPVLFFFTGAHGDYHRPSDTADKINALGIVQVAELAGGVVRALGDKLKAQPAGLTFKKPSGPAPRGGDRGYGAYLGTIPDYTAMQGQQGGVKLSGARPQSPAEQAGVKAGDILVGLGESKINTLEDMAFALRKYKPGQTVDVIVLRDGQRLNLRTTLTQRQ